MGSRRGFGIGVGIVLAGILAALLWQSRRPREPVFEGRTLSSWLERHGANSSADPPYNSPGWHKAEAALRHIGTNAIPTLLQMIRAKDPPRPVLNLLERARQKGWIRVRYRYASGRNEEAEYAFRVLGTNAASAVPELIRIYQKNISASSQRCAALALGHIGRPAQEAVPALVRNFTDTNAEVRFYAVSAIYDIGGGSNLVVPALKRALKDPSVDVRWNAIAGLERFGRSAVPELLEMLNDKGMVGTSSITQHVERVLWRIAPEKVGKLLVVEDPTPMILNGATTEALKVTFHGERKTLIPAGRALPAIAQYWSSDPRPWLTLHRGEGAAGANDHFLGNFEVMDVPDSASVNISTLLVVADGRIVICARDNSRDLSLQIRRVE